VVRLKALSLNYRDHFVIDGVGRWRPPEPRVPVSDGVGIVVGTGSAVTRFAKGNRVAPVFYPRWINGPPSTEKMEGALGGAGADGVYAEYVVVHEAAAVAVPAHLGDEEAATLPCAGVTAWNAVAEGATPRAGETVVLLGTGGVALFALQFAKLLGARVIITSSSDAKLARARELGADAGVNYRTTRDWPRAVRELTGGAGAHLVVDTAGELAAAIEAVRVGGRIAFVGLLRGTQADVDLVKLMGSSATIRAIDVGSREMFESMNRAIESARLRPVIDRTFAFDEARDAFRYLREGAHFGKVCIRV
jgi:NADPH:quinone reductase-like Zn-dependent oxidoreductase